MVRIETLTDSASSPSGRRAFIGRFIDFPKLLYRDDPFWLPWFDRDMKMILTKKHPFFEHSHGEFFLARRAGAEAGETAGRLAVVVNTRYIAHHKKKVAHFCFQDFADDEEVVTALFDAAKEWAAKKGMELLEGPMFAGGIYGSGVLIEGFDSPPPMTMMAYNYPYYRELLEKAGFVQFVDLYSARLDPAEFRLPEKVERIAKLVRKRSTLTVLRFSRARQIRKIAPEIGAVVNESLGHHPEDYPLTDAEIRQLTGELLQIARPELIKILTDGGRKPEARPVGFLFAFPDLSRALRKNRGRVSLLGMIRLLRDFKNEERLIINGMGILPQYQGRGGNALLYDELVKSVKQSGFKETELVQVSERTEMMIKDLERLGADFYKTYRMYSLSLSTHTRAPSA